MLLAAGRRAIALAEAYGWSPATVTGVLYGLKDVLDGHAGTDPIPLSEVRQRLRRRSHSSVTRVAAVVGDLGLLHDDTAAAICAWLDRRVGDLPAGFRRDVHAWLLVLNGDARTRLRSDTTIRVYFGAVWPLIECWAATRGHLREITSRDVDAVLKPLRGHRRYNVISALRLLFRFAKRRGLVFADPTCHLAGGRHVERIVLPMTAQEIHAVQQAPSAPRNAWWWPLPRSTPPGRKRSANSPSTTSTCPAGGSPSPATPSPSGTSPARSCWRGWSADTPPGRAPPTGTS